MTQIAEPPTFETAIVPEPLTASPMTMVQALNRALHEAMAADERVLVFGEDVATLGGVFRVTEGLNAAFGSQRCFDTPLAESGVIGIAVGLALRGFVPVPKSNSTDFPIPLSIRWSAIWRNTGPAPADRSTCRSRYGSRRSAASGRSNITRNPPSLIGRTPRGSKSLCHRLPRMPTGYCDTPSRVRIR